MWGQGKPEHRLQRLEGLLGQLLGNPSIDNARRGPLQIADADTLPGNARNTRIQWPITPEFQSGSITDGYDTTNGWPFVELSGTSATIVNYRDLASLVLLPDFRCQVARTTASFTGAELVVGFSLLLGSATQSTDKCILFRSTAAGNWFALTHNGTSSTATNLGIAPTTAPQLFRIRLPSPTQVEFFLDNTLVHRETTTLPTLTGGEVLQVGVGIDDSLGVNAGFRVAQWLALSTLILGS